MLQRGKPSYQMGDMYDGERALRKTSDCTVVRPLQNFGNMTVDSGASHQHRSWFFFAISRDPRQSAGGANCDIRPAIAIQVLRTTSGGTLSCSHCSFSNGLSDDSETFGSQARH